MGSTTPKDPARQKALNDSYSKATRWLIEQHQDEFNAQRQKILKDANIEWAPKPTQEQRDEATLLELLDRNPDLAKKFGAGERALEGTAPMAPPTDAHS